MSNKGATNFFCEKFKLELEIPYMWMAPEAINVLQPFLSLHLLLKVIEHIIC